MAVSEAVLYFLYGAGETTYHLPASVYPHTLTLTLTI